PGLARMDDPGNDLPGLVANVDQNRRTGRVEVPDVVGDVLEVADVFAGLEIEGDQRVGVEVVAGAQRSVEIGRRIADHEIDAVGGEIDRRVLPNAAAQRLVGIAGLGELLLLGLNVAVHVAAGRVLLRPDAGRILWNGVEIPNELAVLGVVGAYEAAHAVFAAIGADQHFAFDHGRRHGLAVAELGIGDVGLPDLGAGLGVQRDELGVEGGEVDLVLKDRDAAIVRTAAIGGDRPALWLASP